MSEVTEGEYFLLTNSEKLLFLKLDLFDLQVYNCQDLNCFIFIYRDLMIVSATSTIW